MRKMLEIIKISKEHHTAWGGSFEYMCNAAGSAYRAWLITQDERAVFCDFIEEFTSLISEGSCISLHSAIECVADLSRYSYEDIMYLVYEAIIDKLESEGD